MGIVRDERCDRARTYASLRLDSELSELEDALLRAHLERCEPCRSFAGSMAAATAELRRTPMERLEHPIELPRKRRFSLQTAPAAAAAALVAASIGLTGLVQLRDAPSTSSVWDRSFTRALAQEQRVEWKIKGKTGRLNMIVRSQRLPGPGPRVE